MFDTYSDIFSERARSYHRAMCHFPSARNAEFKAMLTPLEGRRVRSICDLPAGGGYLASYLPADWSYTAVEPTDSFADLSVLATGQTMIRSPITAVPLADRSFDAAISLAGLHHEPDKGLVLNEVARLLRDGARAVIADVAEGSRQDLFLNGFVDANSALGHRGEFLGREFADEVARSGLTIESDETVETPWHFGSMEDAAAFATDLFGVSAPPAAVADALDTIIGCEPAGQGVVVRWSLRRIVATRAEGC